MADILQDLTALGFTQHEAKVYVALLRAQPATAYEISKTASIPKVNSYSVLESLSRKQVVRPVSANPVRYVAVAPKILFGRIAAATERRCMRLIEETASLEPEEDETYVWSLEGRDVIDARIEATIDAARSHVWVKGSEDILERFRHSLEGAVSRGVSVLIILFGQNPDRFDFGGDSKVYLHEASGRPIGSSKHIFIVTRDFEESLIADYRTGVQSTHTHNKTVVSVVDTLLRHEVYLAEIFAIFGKDIDAIFGPALSKLRERYFPKQDEPVRSGVASRPRTRRQIPEPK